MARNSEILLHGTKMVCHGLGEGGCENGLRNVEDTVLLITVEMMLTPEQFAEILCDDLELPPSSFAGPIAQSIRQQCEQFSTDMIPEDEEDRRVIVKVCKSRIRIYLPSLPPPHSFPLHLFLPLFCSSTSTWVTYHLWTSSNGTYPTLAIVQKSLHVCCVLISD